MNRVYWHIYLMTSLTHFLPFWCKMCITVKFCRRYNLILKMVSVKIDCTYIVHDDDSLWTTSSRDFEQWFGKARKTERETCQRVKNHHYAAAEWLKIAEAIKLGCSDWGVWVLSRSETAESAEDSTAILSHIVSPDSHRVIKSDHHAGQRSRSKAEWTVYTVCSGAAFPLKSFYSIDCLC